MRTVSDGPRPVTSGAVVTPYGQGMLLAVRPNGICEVKLKVFRAYLPNHLALPLSSGPKRVRRAHSLRKLGVEYQRRTTKMKKLLRIERQLQINMANWKHRSETGGAVRSDRLPVIHLTRGGYYVRTKAGPVQVGMPPETIKDSLSRGLTLPTNFVIPKERFDLDKGINLAEFEFPAYYNFFILRKRVNLITTREIASSIRTIFQETLLGPKEIEPPEYYSDACPRESYPDLMKEMSYFRVDPFTKNPLTIDTLLQFTYFDESGVAALKGGVTIENKGEKYVFRENGKLLVSVCSSIWSHPPESFEGLQPKKRAVHPRASLVVRDAESFRKRVKEFASSKPPRALRTARRHQRLSSVVSGFVTPQSFTPPYFGVTMLGNSHGFDPNGTTTGFVVWINRRGIMVDPPPYSSEYLRSYGIPPALIREIILTHCHADHDAGTFQKILEEHKVTLLTTPVIMKSFLRKYSAISGFSIDFLKRLFIYKPVVIGERVNLHGGQLNFFYSLHSIPCIGFSAYCGRRSMIYSGDTLNHAPGIQALFDKGLLSEGRRDQLTNFPWHHDLVLHECGVPPIHTPVDTLLKLDSKTKARLYVVHVTPASVEKKGLKVAKVGPQNTIVISNRPDEKFASIEVLELVRDVEFLSGIGVDQVCDILQCAVKKKYRKGAVVIREGSVGSKFYIVAMGYVEASVGGRKIKDMSVCDQFGETSLMFGDRKYSVSITAATDVELLEFDSRSLYRIIGDTKALQVLRNFDSIRKQGAWVALQENSCFNKWSALKLRSLQAILVEKDFKANEVLWKKGDPAEFALLVESGSFAFKEAGSNQIHPFRRGAFVGDFSALLNQNVANAKDASVQTTLVSTESGSGFVALKAGLMNFIANHPGAILSFLRKNFIE